MAFKVFSSLAAKLTLLVMAGSSLVFSLVLTYSYLDSRAIILAKAEEIARNLALSTAERMELELRAVQEITDQVAAVLGYAHLDDKEIRRLLKHNVQREPEIFGSTVAFEPFAFDPKIKWYAPYYCKEGNTVQYVNLATDSYNYESQEWYIKPKELKTPLWTPPYFDEGGGNVIMTTYAAPFFVDSPDMPGRKVAGIVTADLSVEWLTKHLESIRVAASGYCFLISETGVFLAHPNKDLIMRQSIFSVAARPGLAHLKEVGRIMLKDRDGFLDLGKALAGQDSFLGFARLPNNGWSLGVVFPKKELFSDIEKLYRANAVIALAGSLLLLAMSLIVARSIARPLRRMADVTGRVASGELDLNLPESKRSDEVGRLAQAFSRMTVDLKRYIQELTVATAEKQRIESELSIAAEIQRNLLPTDFPTSSGSENLDIFAMMEPARHVGGDFYDFFPVGDRLFYFSIGDVCGKGIPAALLMARTKSLLESIVGENTDPAHLLARVNDRLAERNDQCVFVTLFLGILDLSNGELVYGNAGHEAPIFFRQDDEAAVLDQPHGPALGLFPGEQFPTSKITMKPGDVLFTFTDGITEALDKEGSLFSKERLLEEVKHLRRPKVDDLVNGVYRAVKSFARGTDQADDITLLALKLAGKRSPGQA